ncbi:hypothetical protein Egran_01226 [Elaphomyces granulatus]|uniref:ATP-dependent DNA helicase n=1 Tax=Elaphomyces granulatus TaxID=519963 RepID=A0A232M3Y8_9EURO|nr:hypothetical protein Egran_01226 [Elaphomyces granulatus]
MQSKLAEQLRRVGLMIWDEVPMTNRKVFEAVDCTLRDIKGEAGEDFIFDGIPFVLGGDFAQTLPVVKNGRRSRPPKGGGVNADFASWLSRMSYGSALHEEIELLAYIQRT